MVRLPGRTPLIFIEVPGDSDDTVLLYGHLDKQPEMKRLGRGHRAVDPGAARATSSMAAAAPTTATRCTAALCALLALADQKVPRARCVILIEACEE